MSAQEDLFAGAPVGAADAGGSVKKLHAVSKDTTGPVRSPKENGFATTEEFWFGLTRVKPAAPFCPPTHAIREFVFNEALAHAMRTLAIGKNIFLMGQPGTGKTLLAQWIAHELGWDLYLQSHTAQTQIDELGVQPVEGSDGRWHFELGKVYSAYKNGGILLLDELPAVRDAGVGKFYYPILNRDPITVMTENGLEVIYPHPNFRAIATGNHWNKTSGNYELGEALVDRVVFVEVGYLPAKLEVKLLVADAPSVPSGFIRDIVTFAHRTREAAKVAESRAWCLSTRVLRDMLGSVEHADIPLADAVDLHIKNTLRIKYPEQYETTIAILDDLVTI